MVDIGSHPIEEDSAVTAEEGLSTSEEGHDSTSLPEDSDLTPTKQERGGVMGVIDYVRATPSRMAGAYYAVSDTGNVIAGFLAPVRETGDKAGILQRFNPFKILAGVFGYLSSYSLLVADREDVDGILDRLDTILAEGAVEQSDDHDAAYDVNSSFGQLYEIAKAEEEKLTWFEKNLEKKAVHYGGVFQAIAAGLMSFSGAIRESKSIGEITNGILNIIGFAGLGNKNTEKTDTDETKKGVSSVKDFVVNQWHRFTSANAFIASVSGLVAGVEEYKRADKIEETEGASDNVRNRKIGGVAQGVTSIISVGGDYNIWQLRQQEEKEEGLAVTERTDICSRAAVILHKYLQGAEEGLRSVATEATASFIAAQRGIQQTKDELAKRLESRLDALADMTEQMIEGEGADESLISVLDSPFTSQTAPVVA